MQSSLEIFCEECGAANLESATVCVACQSQISSTPAAQPIVPVKVSTPPPLQVVAGAPLSLKSLNRGEVLAGRYRILRELGQGGFGAVYKARDLQRRGRFVAIKQMNLSLLKPRETIEATDAFNREIRFLSTLSHSHLPEIYDHFTDPGHWYLVMEYIEGQTLEEYLRRSRRGYLPASQVVKIGLEVMDVLTYLHSQRPPVIFRDIKPDNIMLTRRGRLYLIDFGIARRFAPGKSKDTGPLGSPGYAAPEQYGRTQTDERTDIYGLGATLQTLLTGRDPLELRQGLLPLQPDPIPAELQALIDSMLEVDPEKRPQHVRIIEERFAWWARKTVDWLTAVKGVLIGLFFWVWYALLEWGISILRHSDFSHMLIPPFKVRLFLVVLNIFPLAIVGTAIYQGFALLFREKNRRIQAACVLIMLLLLFLLSLLLKLPPLFQGYPFFPAPPFKP